MAYWNTDVMNDQSFEVNVDKDKVVFLKSVRLDGNNKETKEFVDLFVTLDGNKFLIASIDPENRTDVDVHLVLNQKFELSHSLKDGIVWFYYYELNQPKIQKNPIAKVYCKLCKRKFNTKGDLLNHSQDKHQSK